MLEDYEYDWAAWGGGVYCRPWRRGGAVSVFVLCGSAGATGIIKLALRDFEWCATVPGFSQ
jgi:hypothetical protein